MCRSVGRDAAGKQAVTGLGLGPGGRKGYLPTCLRGGVRCSGALGRVVEGGGQGVAWRGAACLGGGGGVRWTSRLLSLHSELLRLYLSP